MLKSNGKRNSLCVHEDCDYDSTICRKHEKDNLKFQSILKDGIRWKNQKQKDLGHKEPEVTLVTEVSEQEGKIACNNAYSQMESCRKKMHVNLEELFLYDPNSPQDHKENGTEQFALVTEVRIDDRTNKRAMFEFALIKGERGQGILTVFESASSTTLIL